MLPLVPVPAVPVVPLLEPVPDPELPVVAPEVVSGEEPLGRELLPVALAAPLSSVLLAIELLREAMLEESANASCCVPEPLNTTSSIEPIFWPSRS